MSRLLHDYLVDELLPSNSPTTTHGTPELLRGLSADYSRIGLVGEEMQAKLIQRSAEIGELQEAELPSIGPDYTLEQIEAENREFWPTHCEALRQGRGDLLTQVSSRSCLPLSGWPISWHHRAAAAGEALVGNYLSARVTMCWPIVQFWGEFTHFEWFAWMMKLTNKSPRAAFAGSVVVTVAAVTARVSSSHSFAMSLLLKLAQIG